MANQQHLDILKQGVQAWNQWRQEHPDIQPDLSETRLGEIFPGGIHLEGANLSGANLRGAILGEANVKKNPFGGVADLEELFLTVSRLAVQVDLGENDMEGAMLTGAHLEGANLSSAHLEDAYLILAHLEQANLREAHLERANLGMARLVGAELREAHLEGADLSIARLEGTHLAYAHLEGAKLYRTHLERADLLLAHLEGADLSEAHLEGANLKRTLLAGADFFDAHLEGADLWLASFDTTTRLDDIKLGGEKHGSASLADVSWNGVNLTVVDWSPLKILGDEHEARQWKKSKGKKTRQERKDWEDTLRFKYEVAVRANRQLAVVLQGQGLNEVAARFAYRAQKLQRIVLWKQRRFGQYLFSLFLNLIAGYGYRLWRSFASYVLVIVGFATVYYLLGSTAKLALSPLDAVVFSVTSFHGRGFSPGENIGLSNPITVLAAIEAFVGLIIEVTLIATLTQRFFGR